MSAGVFVNLLVYRALKGFHWLNLITPVLSAWVKAKFKLTGISAWLNPVQVLGCD